MEGHIDHVPLFDNAEHVEIAHFFWFRNMNEDNNSNFYGSIVLGDGSNGQSLDGKRAFFGPAWRNTRSYFQLQCTASTTCKPPASFQSSSISERTLPQSPSSKQ